MWLYIKTLIQYTHTCTHSFNRTVELSWYKLSATIYWSASLCYRFSRLPNCFNQTSTVGRNYSVSSFILHVGKNIHHSTLDLCLKPKLNETKIGLNWSFLCVCVSEGSNVDSVKFVIIQCKLSVQFRKIHKNQLFLNEF